MTDPLATAPAARPGPAAALAPTVVPAAPPRPPAATATAPADDPAYRATMRRRMRILAVLQALNALTFLPFLYAGVDDQFTVEMFGPVGMTTGVGFLVLSVVVAVALTVRRDWSVRQMRWMDAAALVLLTATLAAWHHTRLVRSAELPSDGPNHARLRIEAANVHVAVFWFLAPFIYGVFVPGPTRWQAARFLPMAAVALLAVVTAGARSPEVAARLPLLLTALSSSVLTSAAVVIYGSYRVNTLSAEVAEARQELAELGQYKLGRRLGAGGMGEVYLAEHRFLKRACAVKRIRPEMAADPAYARRFGREVAAVTRLAHPAAVQVYDYGRSADGTLYYVMEYLPGLTLDAVVARAGPLPAGRVVGVLRQLCGALAEAHGLGMVHRDVKPGNVMVGRFGGRADSAKLLDFGLVAEAGSADTRITAAGGLLGTPAYMSPEQARGEDAGPAADLYAVGGVGYFLLTGRPPFTADHPLALLHAHQTEPVVPPSVRVPGVPADVEAVVLRLLAKAPADRFPSATATADALAGCGSAGSWSAADAEAWWKALPGERPA